MGKLEPFDKKQTNWEGLWYHPEYGGFSSACINLADLRKFKGNVRLYIRKNKYFNKGENGRPNYHFCLKDADADVFHTLEIEDEEDQGYTDREGNRLFTREEVRRIINGTFDDVKYGISDPYDILPEDFV